jgi:hypothetical protein
MQRTDGPLLVGGVKANQETFPLQIDASGNLKVTSGGGGGGTSSTDGAAFTPGASSGTPAMGVYESTPVALGNGQLGVIAVDVNRNVIVRTLAQGTASSVFTGVHVPVTNTQATVTQASAGAGKRNVCTGITVTLCAGTAAVGAMVPLTVALIDGVSGGTTYLWRDYINIPAVAGAVVTKILSGKWLVGSQATAMTLEFSAAGGANSFESVAFDGVILTE